MTKVILIINLKQIDKTAKITIAQSDPSVVAFTEAERGMLYINASSPKLPESVYSPSSIIFPSSNVQKNLNVPLN
jgi:hypothetical protein